MCRLFAHDTHTHTPTHTRCTVLVYTRFAAMWVNLRYSFGMIVCCCFYYDYYSFLGVLFCSFDFDVCSVCGAFFFISICLWCWSCFWFRFSMYFVIIYIYISICYTDIQISTWLMFLNFILSFIVVGCISLSLSTIYFIFSLCVSHLYTRLRFCRVCFPHEISFSTFCCSVSRRL